jgi:hypothetical protein
MFLMSYAALLQAAATPVAISKQQFLADPIAAIQGDWETNTQSRNAEVYARLRIDQSKMTVTYLNQTVDPYMIRSYAPVGGVQIEFQGQRSVEEYGDGRTFVTYWNRYYLKSQNAMQERYTCQIIYNEAYYAAPKGSIQITCSGLNFVRAEHNKKIAASMSPGFRSWDY